MEKFTMYQNLGPFEEPVDCFSINQNSEEDLSIFDGAIGFKVFDNEIYADDFIEGKFRTVPLNWYSKKENEDNPNYDENEGNIVYFHRIDASKQRQIFRHLDGKEFILMTELLKKEMEKDNKDINNYLLQYTAPLSIHVFCFTWCYFNDIDKTFRDGSVLKEISKFGDYIVSFPIKTLFKKCACDETYEFMGCGKVMYSDSLLSHFLIKRKKFEKEHEFRIFFLNSDDKPLFHNIGKLQGAKKIKISTLKSGT